jgi:arylsulfatase A-like enzyme
VKKPNVVYLLADQLTARSLPAYGERQMRAPVGK